MRFYLFFLVLDSYGLFLALRYLVLLIKRGYIVSRDSGLTLPVVLIMGWQLIRISRIISAPDWPVELRNLQLVAVENFYLGWFWIEGGRNALPKVIRRALHKLRHC